MTINLLDCISSPCDLKKLNTTELTSLAKDIRREILELVSKTGGHLSSNLGVVELTLAIHYVFNAPKDRIIWDVGHQSYVHKILTGRRELMSTLRQYNGISGFPNRSESCYDAFGTAHSSTSISAALGMAFAAKELNIIRNNIAIIGDGAISSGMAFEAMNNAGNIKDINLIVILNDNHMSISQPVGSLNNYFSQLMDGRFYAKAKNVGKVVLRHIPSVLKLAKSFESHAKDIIKTSIIFEEFGFRYFGPINGHNIDDLISELNIVNSYQGLKFLHIVTKKGKGYKLAEKDPILYHGPGKFNINTGIKLPQKNITKTFTNIFSEWICDMARSDSKLIAITPAMSEGSGLVKFEELYPERYFDVGISEQHAITFAAGMSCDGLKPVVAIYSTFLQRGYDQFIHDICIQGLDVTLALDRAGIVGADGPTHAGNYDISFLRCIPGIVIATPSDENEERILLNTCYKYQGPASVRYPRGSIFGVEMDMDLSVVEIGKGVIRRIGKNIAILCFGTLLQKALDVADILNTSVVDMRFVKPIDYEMIIDISKNHKAIVTIEDSSIMGGAGSAVLETLQKFNLLIPVLQLGIPDCFIAHGDTNILMSSIGLDVYGIENSIRSRFYNLID
ncbi:1-deoxy-D-xylulose-5-phosphate synthase [Candidatus Kinetoplastibacterium blastocrithidii TCC012E]|uniref:1-deoxy-D-xylulose-5-phosphate synthase n=2 Tax=cellular organisms TaxID=131567 RepID=M1MDK7_9PROT|nr:1-deoxy-D-xylulose-5-phosphate synthase [Candidatus Kinetoplastibacterium blastocrithidii]AFZ83683.1 1-deoxy-D-xylulose-5-phosphate synthase [Candidatus Kinetoplastibacterium blastocrithidii (ex Strigomonas culicis)]AGF49805.1 1-deoxy-D-xylulose-5-phosphate synthase [Candidatus Kinetoplastibacterium blastocrithidii TCC012E]